MSFEEFAKDTELVPEREYMWLWGGVWSFSM